MCGQWWPLGGPGGWEPWGVEGCGVVVVGVVVVGVVDWVLVEPLGAAAAPVMPAIAPPHASAATTIPALMVLALLIREPPMVAWCLRQPCLRVPLSEDAKERRNLLTHLVLVNHTIRKGDGVARSRRAAGIIQGWPDNYLVNSTTTGSHACC